MTPAPNFLSGTERPLISCVVEGEDPDTVRSKTFARRCVMTKKEEDKPVYLIDEMASLTDLDLVKVALSALAVLHNRAEEAHSVIAEELDKTDETQAKVYNRDEYVKKHGSAEAIPKSK